MTCLTAPEPLPSWQALAAVRAVQVTTTLLMAGQPVEASPSETVSVSVAVPAEVQTKRVSSAVALVKTPDVDVQSALSGEGPLSESWAVALRPTDPPTSTSAGVASRPAICGQTFKVPLTNTLPVCGA